ncbi:MAG: uroporphyrinogen synthase [Hyphomicrobiales bacterium]|jgi:uroporphyrinogen-III synthase|nr:uroporphyrinogen synthase [Hyphomicrobiales bacterium]
MRILLTRPEADAQRSAARLEALGHEVVIAPLFEIVPTGAPKPDGPCDRLLATSAHAFDGLPAQANHLTALRLDVVGERTAAAARAIGFAQIGIIATEAKALAIALAREGRQPQDFLYLAGRERRPDLEAALAALGHRVTPWIVYETRERESAVHRLPEIWAQEHIDAVLHFSPRSAALYVALAERAGLRTQALAPIQVAISPRAAQRLTGAQDVRTAPTPDLDGLLSCL